MSPRDAPLRALAAATCPIGGERALQRRCDIGRLLDANAERAHILGESSEVHRIVGPQLARFFGRLIAVGTVESAL